VSEVEVLDFTEHEPFDLRITPPEELLDNR